MAVLQIGALPARQHGKPWTGTRKRARPAQRWCVPPLHAVRRDALPGAGSAWVACLAGGPLPWRSSTHRTPLGLRHVLRQPPGELVGVGPAALPKAQATADLHPDALGLPPGPVAEAELLGATSTWRATCSMTLSASSDRPRGKRPFQGRYFRNRAKASRVAPVLFRSSSSSSPTSVKCSTSSSSSRAVATTPSPHPSGH